MDYVTQPISREKIRQFSFILRKLFDVPIHGPFPVLDVLDKLPDVFKHCYYEIVEDDAWDYNTVAQCCENSEGGFTIKIKAYVYYGAYEKKIGAYLGFIMHEICHVFLNSVGFKPILERCFDDAIPLYCSAEWQAKSLCGETMIPYSDSIGMDKYTLMETYHVSKGIAEYRTKL
ncbi:MAG: hypothetical protein Q4E54_08520 [Lachnospiraceae bacterium]|nr:hypothetical protein [Lachnospiraceae bacterium]